MAKNKPPAVEERVRDFLKRHNPGGQRLLVAVSGGADSVCLLHVLINLREELKLNLHVAHLDHGLRGVEAKADAAYVSRLASRLGVPVTIEKRDVTAYRQAHRLSTEEAAREVRYRFLAETAASIGSDMVAVGHTSDDQVETALMHLVRG
ncbi:MAG: tRNA lysidine(34) synthetase TilS, partial [Dehalococcoidales bacterium]